MEKITPEHIIQFIYENDIPYTCTQPKLCVPIVNRIYRKMLAGIRFLPIRVDAGLICDGHHRYMASLLANYSLEVVPFIRTSATKEIDWKAVVFDIEDWDTQAKIRMLNQQDADYNSILIEKLTALLL